MGRRKGSKNKPKPTYPLSQLQQPVTDADIQRKMKILYDFGLTKNQIISLYNGQNFINLEALESFTSSVIRRALSDDPNIAI